MEAYNVCRLTLEPTEAGKFDNRRRHYHAAAYPSSTIRQ
jgi:hypothetical protein